MAGNGERLKGSQLGYRGKGVPDPDTIRELQMTYGAAVEAGGLPPAIRTKLTRMRDLTAKVQASSAKNLDQSETTKAFEEAAKLASELAPILHFRVDDVDWDN